MVKVLEEGERRFWQIGVEGDVLFRRVCRDTNYRAQVLGSSGLRVVMGEADRDEFECLFKKAVSGLWIELERMCRRFPKGLVLSDDGARMRLEVTEGYDEGLLGTLGVLVEGYVEGMVLAGWYERSGLVEVALLCQREAMTALEGILRVVHFRKKGTGRPVNPLF